MISSLEARAARERVRVLYNSTDRLKWQMKKPWQHGKSDAELKREYRHVIDELTELNIKLRKYAEELKRYHRTWHERRDREESARPSEAGSMWWNVLKIERSASVAEINTAWRKRARECHPDVGGSLQEMQMVNLARDQALNAKKGPASRS